MPESALYPLYTQLPQLFADPFTPLPPGSSNLMSIGTNRDTLYVCGWLDLSNKPQIQHVPDFSGRYYSVQLTDASKNINFAYVGKRTTGTKAGDYLIIPNPVRYCTFVIPNECEEARSSRPKCEIPHSPE